MKCEECMPLFEEHLDGELKEPLAARVAAHINACTVCAAEFAQLLREQEIYAGYRREIEVTPALWQGVRAQIEAEKVAESPARTARWLAWLTEAFTLRTQMRPAFTAALVLIALGITTIAVTKYLGQRGQTTLSQVSTAQNNLKQVEINRLTRNKTGGEELAVVTPDEKKTDAPVIVHERQPEKAFPASASSRNGNRLPLELTPEAAPTAESITATNLPQPAGDANLEIARHVEKAQMLLRSFRNVRLAETSHAPDISYEKEESRKLLYKNIVLRREAATQGNASAEKVLSTLEPILLDIANLPNRATARDVRSIEQRMRKKEIVATLQLHSLIAPNSY